MMLSAQVLTGLMEEKLACEGIKGVGSETQGSGRAGGNRGIGV